MIIRIDDDGHRLHVQLNEDLGATGFVGSFSVKDAADYAIHMEETSNQWIKNRKIQAEHERKIEAEIEQGRFP